MSVATIWSVTLKLSIMILEASFTLIYDVFSTVITYDDYHMFIVQAGSTKGGGITVPLTSCLTGLESAV